MNKYKAIKTEVGLLVGRDCIFLDNAKFQNSMNNLKLSGGLNGSLCTESSSSEEISYTIIFKEILALKMIELDSNHHKAETSFDEVINSEWIKNLGAKVTNEYKHYYFQTYDQVFELACTGYALELNKNV